MKRLQQLFFVTAVSAAFAPSVCLGFGDEGHQIVGDIAYYELTTRTRAAVLGILQNDDDPKYRRLYGATVWADDIKDKDHPQHNEFRWARRLHYVNLPEDRHNYVESEDCKTKYDCPDDLPCPHLECVVAAIEFYVDVLKNDHSSSEQKLIALKFIVHFVGDIHQPLHAGLRSDTGGGSIEVRFFNTDTNLHSVWDSGLIRREIKSEGWNYQDGWKKLSDELRGTITDEQRALWKSELDPREWAKESAILAQSVAYANPTEHRRLRDNDLLRTQYYDKSLPVVEECLKRGGVRLGALLNSIFDVE